MLEDLLKGITDRTRYDHSRLEHRHERYRDDRYGHYNPLLDPSRKLLRNKAVIAGIAVVILLAGAVGIWLIAALLPYLGQLIFLMEERGIKGLLDMIEHLFQQIWEGGAAWLFHAKNLLEPSSCK